MKKVLLASIAALFLTVTPAFAGGGPLGIDDVYPQKPFENTKAFIVGVSIYTPVCDSVEIKANLEDQADGDSVTPFTPPADGTYLERHYFTGTPQNTWVKICKQYFKVTSTTPKQRTFVGKAVIDGETAKITTPLAFGDDQYSLELQNLDRYSYTPQIDVISEKSLGGPKREVKVQWNKVPGAQKYAVFAREMIFNGQQTETGAFLPPLAVTEDNKATINLASDLDFNLSAQICNEQLCSVQPEPYEVVLSRLQPSGTNTNTNVSTSESTSTMVVITPASNPNEEKMEKLNKKVAELEGKLEESNKKQNVLEEKLSQLINFIRSLFPTFQ